MRRPSPSSVAEFVRRFLTTETAAGQASVAAIVLALVAANSPWHVGYASFWDTHLTSSGSLHLPVTLCDWIADGAMTLFFFVIGLEVKREMVAGELRHWRAAALPIVAAAGGMVFPAVLYITLTAGTGLSHGWAVPMATDLAVAVGVVALLGPRVPQGLKVFLLTLAVVDDVGAVVAIAVAFTETVHIVALVVAVVLVVALAMVEKRRGVHGALVAAVGVAVWLATLRSGVHPTVAGVALAFALPVGRRTARLEEAVHPWASTVIVPLFVLCEAGVRVADVHLSDARTLRVVLSVALALLLGKVLGVTVTSWIAVKLRLGRLPTGATWWHMVAIGVTCGIGLTVAVLVADLAFVDDRLRSAAKLGVLLATSLAAVLGAAALAIASRLATTRPDT